ncbi:MAG: aminotransferase class V-fold PLP-dependent enzyme [Proteobacteria bacterium]|nr:aminotransferase class V-fold PLP-dependent enzyme [Pseudomonadota bacterium]
MTAPGNSATGRAWIREQFPILDQGLYLNHAAIAPWPRCTADEVQTFARENALRGPDGYRDWIVREKELRRMLARLTGARSKDDIALLKNTTEGISLVAWGLDWQAGDNIVLPRGEFPSNRLPWLAQSVHGVEIHEVDIRTAENAENALLKAMNSHTRLLSVSAVQWNDGFRLDLEILGKACRSKGVLFFVDAIQQLGALSVNVEACHVDFLAADAHKWLLGPEGIAVFYCRASARPRLRLLQQGWHMFENPWNFRRREWEPCTSAKRFEAGSPNSVGQAALHASLNLLLKIGMEQVSGRILQNTEFLINALSLIPGLQITSRTEPERRSGIVSFTHESILARTLNTRLAESGVTCAVRGNAIRLSPHFYQDQTDLSKFIQILERVI